MATFGSIQFDERGSSNRFVARPDTAAVLAVTHVPGAAGDNVQYLGVSSGRLQLTISCGVTSLNALYAGIGDEETLTYSGGSSTMVLEQISNVLQLGALDWFEATLMFIKV